MRWEYKTISVKRSFFSGGINAKDLELDLNALGREGWELVCVNQNHVQGVVAVLKRSKP
jgi:hypothetical protein